MLGAIRQRATGLRFNAPSWAGRPLPPGRVRQRPGGRRDIGDAGLADRSAQLSVPCAGRMAVTTFSNDATLKSTATTKGRLQYCCFRWRRVSSWHRSYQANFRRTFGPLRSTPPVSGRLLTRCVLFAQPSRWSLSSAAGRLQNTPEPTW